jgi:hypothetical protein
VFTIRLYFRCTNRVAILAHGGHDHVVLGARWTSREIALSPNNRRSVAEVIRQGGLALRPQRLDTLIG